MSDIKEETLQSEPGAWHRVCELAALPEQAGRSAWLEGRVLALFRLGEHVYALDGVDPLAGVAVLGRVAAGPPIGAGGEVEGYVLLDPTLFHPTPDYLLRVRGDSMRDGGILDGDLIAVRRTAEAISGQTVVARIDGELTVKRLEILDGRLRLLARNPDYPPIEITPEVDDFAIEGLLIGLVRSS